MNRKKPKPRNQKKVGTWIIIMAFFLAELLLYTWCRVQSTRVGYEIAQATQQQRELTTLRSNLKIELARLNLERNLWEARANGDIDQLKTKAELARLKLEQQVHEARRRAGSRQPVIESPECTAIGGGVAP